MDSLGWAGFDPALCRDRNRSWVSIPYTTLGQASAHPNEAMNSIKALHLTSRHYGFFETSRPLPPARQGNAVVRELEERLNCHVPHEETTPTIAAAGK